MATAAATMAALPSWARRTPGAVAAGAAPQAWAYSKPTEGLRTEYNRRLRKYENETAQRWEAWLYEDAGPIRGLFVDRFWPNQGRDGFTPADFAKAGAMEHMNLARAAAWWSGQCAATIRAIEKISPGRNYDVFGQTRWPGHGTLALANYCRDYITAYIAWRSTAQARDYAAEKAITDDYTGQLAALGLAPSTGNPRGEHGMLQRMAEELHLAHYTPAVINAQIRKNRGRLPGESWTDAEKQAEAADKTAAPSAAQRRWIWLAAAGVVALAALLVWLD